MRPLCTHCGLLGHILDKCYKLYSYPLVYKLNKPKLQFSLVNQVPQHQTNSESQPPPLAITQEQCQPLLTMLKHASAHLVGSTSINQYHIFSNMSSTSIISSIFVFYSSHSIFSTTHFHSLQVASNHNQDHNPCIIDTGVANHMIGSVFFFTSITAIVSTHVKLPNSQLAAVTHIGTVKISEYLILTDVLCIPPFSFNMISASKLITLCCCLIFLDSFFLYT